MSGERFWITIVFIGAVAAVSIIYLSLEYNKVLDERTYSNRRHAIEKGCVFIDGYRRSHVVCAGVKP